MKKTVDFVKSNSIQLIELLALIAAIIIPWFFNLQEIFKDYLEENPLSPENILWHTALSYGKYIASIIFFCVLLAACRKLNNETVMNSIRVYHDYSYAWYWICAKVLNIKKCDLVLVPIYMQFKLVINATFADYPLCDNDYPIIDDEPDCKITTFNADSKSNEINLVLEDTYEINQQQLPESKRNMVTIKISRNDGKSYERHYSEKFTGEIINQVRSLDKIEVMNVFATTNPMNTKDIAKRVFGLGNRGNIEHLYVFQQNSKGQRQFIDKGYKIF